MSEERKHKLAMGLRLNRGRLLQPAWLSELSRACGTNISPAALLPVVETEALKQRFFDRAIHGSVQRLFWRGEQRAQVEDMLHAIRQQVSTEVILFSEVDFYIGAVRLHSDVVLDHPFEVWSVVSWDLMMTTPLLEDGFRLEHNTYGLQKTEYELTTWEQFSVSGNDLFGSSRSSHYIWWSHSNRCSIYIESISACY